MPTYTTEVTRKVFNDDTGNYVQIGPDSDGHGLITVIKVNPSVGTSGTIEFESTQEAIQVARAILDAAGEEG